MSIDIKNLSAKALITLIAQAKQQQSKLSKRAPAATVRSKLSKLAKTEGYTIAELFGGKPATQRAAAKKAKPAKKAGRKLGKVAPKYRNPANPKDTWSGRGKHPRWMAALMAKGKKADDFLIKKK